MPAPAIVCAQPDGLRITDAEWRAIVLAWKRGGRVPLGDSRVRAIVHRLRQAQARLVFA
jgi:hypothetical protein